MSQVFSGAQWIWRQLEPIENQYVDFLGSFTSKDETAYTIRISADSQYCLYVNGRLAGFGQYADYPAYKVYDELDITPFVQPGENRFAVGAYSPVTDSSCYRYGKQAVIYELLADGAPIAVSGPDTLCRQHPGYQSGKMDFVTWQLGYSFAYDARGEGEQARPAVALEHTRAFFPRPTPKLRLEDRRPAALQSQGVFHWAPAERADTLGKRMQYAPLAFRELRELAGQPTAPTFPREEGVSFASEEGDGLYLLLDCGEEDAGFLDLELDVDEGTEILIGWGEHTDDLRLRTFVGSRNFAAQYIAKQGRQRFTQVYRRAGLRYVELFVAAHWCTLYYAGVRPTVYPVSEQPAFHVADRLHERIYEVCKRTLLECLHEHYEDCPWREQALYAMDSRNQMLCGYYAFGEYAAPRASLKLLALSLREDGLLELCAPAKVPVTIPSFSAMFIVELYEYLLFSGDKDFAAELLPTARALADAFAARRADNGLIPAYTRKEHWNFYEWQPYLEGYQTHPLDTEPVRFDAPLQCFVVLALSRLADLCDALGEPGGADYRAMADEMRAATHALFWEEETGGYASFANSKNRWQFAQLTQALAVCADVCPDALIDRVLPHLTGGDMVPVTLSYSVFQFDALMRRPETYARWVFNHIADDWGHMLYREATTFWETLVGAPDFDNAGSLCHGWSAVPVYVYFAYGLGLYPTAPGFTEYRVAPVDSGLYELSGRLLTADGRLLEV